MASGCRCASSADTSDSSPAAAPPGPSPERRAVSGPPYSPPARASRLPQAHKRPCRPRPATPRPWQCSGPCLSVASCVRSGSFALGAALAQTPLPVRAPQTAGPEPRRGADVCGEAAAAPHGVDGGPQCPRPVSTALLALCGWRRSSWTLRSPRTHGVCLAGQRPCPVGLARATATPAAGHSWPVCLKPVPFLRLFASLWVS